MLDDAVHPPVAADVGELVPGPKTVRIQDAAAQATVDRIIQSREVYNRARDEFVTRILLCKAALQILEEAAETLRGKV